MQRQTSAPVFFSWRTTSSCLAESWRWSQPTWRMNCGSSTSPDGPGPCGNRLCLLCTPWRATPPTWWSWLAANRRCWPSLATRQYTATSTKFRSTTSVSPPADAIVSLWCVCLIAFYWQDSNTGLEFIDPRTLIFTHRFNRHWLRFHWYLFYWRLVFCGGWTSPTKVFDD